MYSGSGSFPAEEMKYLKLLSNQYKNINSEGDGAFCFRYPW